MLSSHLWSKLPTQDDAGITVDPGGFAFANGGFACTTRDLARFGQLLLDGGCVDGQQVVPEAFAADVLAGGDTAAATGSHFQAVHEGGSYRSQWWVTGDDHGVVYGAGIHGQYLWVDPRAEVVVAKFGAHPEAVSAEALRQNAALMRWLVARYSHVRSSPGSCVHSTADHRQTDPLRTLLGGRPGARAVEIEASPADPPAAQLGPCTSCLLPLHVLVCTAPVDITRSHRGWTRNRGAVIGMTAVVSALSHSATAVGQSTIVSVAWNHLQAQLPVAHVDIEVPALQVTAAAGDRDVDNGAVPEHGQVR